MPNYVNGRWESTSIDDLYRPGKRQPGLVKPPKPGAPTVSSSPADLRPPWARGTPPRSNPPRQTGVTGGHIPSTGNASGVQDRDQKRYFGPPATKVPPPGGSSPQQPANRNSAGHGSAPAAPPQRWSPPAEVDPSRVRDASKDLARKIKLDTPPREKLGDAPARVGGSSRLPDAPGEIDAYKGLGPAPGRGKLDELLGKADRGSKLPSFDREKLAAEGQDNAWEQLALGRFEGGFDPGDQYQGKELADSIYTPEDQQVIASRATAPLIRAYQDAEKAAVQAATAGGGRVDPARMAAMKARAQVENAGALGGAQADAYLAATQANAEQAARSAANKRANYDSNIAARLGIGRMNLDSASKAADVGLQRRGLTQEREIADLSAGVTQRGQDIDQSTTEAKLDADLLAEAMHTELGARGQDINYNIEGGRQGLEARGQNLTQRGQNMDYAVEGGRQGLEARGQDVTQRAQDMDYMALAAKLGVEQRAQELEQSYRAAGLNAEQARARVQAELQQYAQQIDEQQGNARMELDARGQDMDFGLKNRSLDLEESLGLGRLGLEDKSLNQNMANAIADRRQRLEILDRELADRSLDRQSRDALERDRLSLSRELAHLEQQQRERESSRSAGLDERRIGLGEAELGERRRQFDDQLDWQQERDVADQDLNERLGVGRLNQGWEELNRAGRQSPMDLARIVASSPGQLSDRELEFLRELAQNQGYNGRRPLFQMN